MMDDAATEFVARMRGARMRERVDAVTAEVVIALRAHGVRPLLLKGPALVSLLYDDDSRRAYLDADLLVEPSQRAPAERCLARLGFERSLAESDLPGSTVTGEVWQRGGEPPVDLHRTLPGVDVGPGELWGVLTESTRMLAVGGVEVEAPGAAASLAIVTLHVAHHGQAMDQTVEDLRRALERFDAAAWAAAAALARRLRAADAFASGLTLDPAGRRLAAELSLPTELPVDLVLKRSDPPPGSVTLETLATTDGARAKLRLAARKIVPSRRFMHAWFPRARGGPGWLVVGYLWRPLWLGLRAGPAVVAWRRARVAAPSHPRGDDRRVGD